MPDSKPEGQKKQVPQHLGRLFAMFLPECDLRMVGDTGLEPVTSRV